MFSWMGKDAGAREALRRVGWAKVLILGVDQFQHIRIGIPKRIEFADALADFRIEIGGKEDRAIAGVSPIREKIVTLCDFKSSADCGRSGGIHFFDLFI
jgi:hypothetical protein